MLDQPSALIRYEHMRVVVEQCARIDEASDLRDKAAALQAYARQRDDRDLDVWMSEIKLRASVRIGELVRELDSQQGARTELPDSTVGKSKTEAIEAAGLTERTAQRYQELAGPREEQAQAAAKAGAENYFAQARADKKPATMEGLRGAVKDAVTATVGPRQAPAPRKAAQPPEADTSFLSFYSALRPLGERPYDAEALAAAADLEMTVHFCEVAKGAATLVHDFLQALMRREAEDLNKVVLHGQG